MHFNFPTQAISSKKRMRMRMRKKASYTHRAHHSLGDRRRPVPTAVRMRTRKQQAGRRPPAAARGPTEITDDDRCGEERECVDMRCAFGLLVFFASASGSCWSMLQYPGSALFPHWGCDASAGGNSLYNEFWSLLSNRLKNILSHSYDLYFDNRLHCCVLDDKTNKTRPCLYIFWRYLY